MRVKAICKKHPDVPVYMLGGTIMFLDDLGEPGPHISESLENASGFFVDKYNLYCAYAPDASELEQGMPDHDLVLLVCQHEPYAVAWKGCSEMTCWNYVNKH